MREERETCKRTKTQNIVTFYVITIAKRSRAVIPASEQLSFPSLFTRVRLALLFSIRARKLITELVAFHAMTLKINLLGLSSDLQVMLLLKVSFSHACWK